VALNDLKAKLALSDTYPGTGLAVPPWLRSISGGRSAKCAGV